jgi:hypothetical protein
MVWKMGLAMGVRVTECGNSTDLAFVCLDHMHEVGV